MTHDTIADIAFVVLTLVAVAGFAVSASAGAPGLTDGSAEPEGLILQQEPTEDIAPLSPSEVRNVMSVRMDWQAAQGFEVDRASVDGIGLRDYNWYVGDARPR